jgi:hypothetical protein
MPRTVWRQDPSFGPDSKWNSPSHLRACAEEFHHERQRRAWFIPTRISPAVPTDPAFPTDTARVLSFRDFNSIPTGRSLHNLRPDDCRVFCWKDCVIYCNPQVARHDGHALLDMVYREWFPNRAQYQDISHGSFFANLMSFTEPAEWTLKIILCFHEVLCEKLCELEKEIPETVPVNPHLALSYRLQLQPEVAEYRLRDTFSVVFIVVDIGWRERGVLLVWKSKDDALRHNCEEDEEVTVYNGSDSGDLGQACVFRCPLKRAMQFIVSTDLERAKPQREYNEMLQEMLGDADDDNA